MKLLRLLLSPSFWAVAGKLLILLNSLESKPEPKKKKRPSARKRKGRARKKNRSSHAQQR